MWGLNRHLGAVGSSLAHGIGVLRKALNKGTFKFCKEGTVKETLAICQDLDFGAPDLQTYERTNVCLVQTMQPHALSSSNTKQARTTTNLLRVDKS